MVSNYSSQRNFKAANFRPSKCVTCYGLAAGYSKNFRDTNSISSGFPTQKRCRIHRILKKMLLNIQDSTHRSVGVLLLCANQK